MYYLQFPFFHAVFVYMMSTYMVEGFPLKNHLSKRTDESRMSRSIRNVKATFREECFNQHNLLRGHHGHPALIQNTELERLAQEWADTLVRMRLLKRSKNERYGENGAYKHTSQDRRITGDEICNQWYAEIKNYDFDRPGRSKNGGKITHFSQVVWKNTKEIGIGVADDGQGTLFAVALYNPPGNYIRQFKDNVNRPSPTIHVQSY